MNRKYFFSFLLAFHTTAPPNIFYNW